MKPIVAAVEQVLERDVLPIQPTTLYVAYNDDGKLTKQTEGQSIAKLWPVNGYRVVAYRLDPNATSQPTVKLPTDEEIGELLRTSGWQEPYRVSWKDAVAHIAAKLKGDKQ